jgi:CheY-like chemotaxis protein
MSSLLEAFGALFLKRPPPAVHNDDEAPAEKTKEARCTILAIDDDAAFLDTLRPALRMEGFNVMTAISGTKGLDIARFTKNEVRVVLLDFQMPRLTGLETLQHLRKLMPHAKVLGLTGLPQKDLPEEFCASVDHLMCKPYRTAELVQCINSLAGIDESAVAES